MRTDSFRRKISVRVADDNKSSYRGVRVGRGVRVARYVTNRVAAEKMTHENMSFHICAKKSEKKDIIPSDQFWVRHVNEGSCVSASLSCFSCPSK